MSKAAFDSAPAYDQIGRIIAVKRDGGFVTVRRLRARTTFLLSEKDWRKLPKEAAAGAAWQIIDGRARPVVATPSAELLEPIIDASESSAV